MEKKLLMAAKVAGIEVAKDTKELPEASSSSTKSALDVLKDIDLESDFDPDKFDEQMSSTWKEKMRALCKFYLMDFLLELFDEEYYAQKDDTFIPDEENDIDDDEEKEDNDEDYEREEAKHEEKEKEDDIETEEEGEKSSKKTSMQFVLFF